MICPPHPQPPLVFGGSAEPEWEINMLSQPEIVTLNPRSQLGRCESKAQTTKNRKSHIGRSKAQDVKG